MTEWIWAMCLVTVVAVAYLAGWLGVLALAPVFWQAAKLVEVVAGSLE